MDKRKIWESGNHRIMEYAQDDIELDDLKGDSYNYEASGYTGTREALLKEEKDFEYEIESEGVYGYVLEKWNPAVDAGWEHVDSCWGFVGQYQEAPDHKYHHYIVAELIERSKDND